MPGHDRPASTPSAVRRRPDSKDRCGIRLLFGFTAAAYERQPLGNGSHWPFECNDPRRLKLDRNGREKQRCVECTRLTDVLGRRARESLMQARVRGRHRETWWGLIGAVTVIAVISALEAESSAVYIGLLAIAPFVAAALGDPLATRVAALLAIGAGVVIGILDPNAGGTPQFVRLAGIAAASCLAVVVVTYRVRRDTQLFALRAVALAAQEAILFPLPERVGDIGLAVYYQSAAAGAVVGGDLYDVATGPYGLRLMIGDVRGKGLPAVRMASIVLGAFREATQLYAHLTEVVDRLDAAAARFGGEEDFVTATLLDLEGLPDGVAMIRCGHPLPVLIPRASAAGVEVGAQDATLPLGLRGPAFSRAEDVETFAFQPGDRLLLFTDGLIEARKPGGPTFGVKGVLSICAVASRWGSQEFLERLVAAASRHAGGNLDDDVALLLVEHLEDGKPIA